MARQGGESAPRDAPTHREGRFQGAGDLQLYYQSWHPEGAARATLVIVHGIGEHSGRYMNVVHYLVPRGYAVYGFDHRGHGRSPGQRGHINDWSEYREDVDAFLRMVRSREGERPLFVFGHSLGALIVLEFVLRRPDGLRGVIISGAPIEPVGVAKPYLVALARLLSRLWPRFSLSTRLDTPAISRDPAVVHAYRTDPLVHRTATARWGTECLAAIAWVKAHAAELHVPILLLHGGADRLNSPDGTARFFAQITHPDKTMHIYPGAFHEPHNDVHREEVLRDIAQWLQARVPPHPPAA